MKVKIDSKLMNYLEGIFFEYNGLKTILESLILYKEECINKDVYDYFIEDYKTTNLKFEILKSEILNEYAPSFKGKNVTFDFETNQIILNGEGHE